MENKNFKPTLAIIGGSGLCKFPELKKIRSIKLKTKYGPTSDSIIIGKFKDNIIAFLPRHGRNHEIPPHRIPYKANIVALKMLGVKKIISTCIAGSLKKEIVPGSFVLPDQFIDMTRGRDDYFSIENYFKHLPMKDPFCNNFRNQLFKIIKRREKK